MEKVVNAALDDAPREAKTLLVARLGAVSLAELAQGFGARCANAPSATNEAEPPS